MIIEVKDCDGKIKMVDSKYTGDMRTNRHCSTDGHEQGWIDFGPTTICWSDKPYSYFTQDNAKSFCNQMKDIKQNKGVC